MKFSSIIILFMIFVSRGKAQGPPYKHYEHSKSSILDNCIIMITQKRSKSYNNIFSFQEFFDCIKIEESTIDSIAYSHNFQLERCEIDTTSFNSSHTPIIKTYTLTNNSLQKLTIRKICLGKYELSNSCTESTIFNWVNPISFESNKCLTFIHYKEDFLTNHNDFTLKKCAYYRYFKSKFYVVVETYESEIYSVSFSFLCKKVKETEDGFLCKRPYNFKIEIEFTKNYLDSIQKTISH